MWVQTEDYALGMELKKEGYHCRYVREYLALGAHALREPLQTSADARGALAETGCCSVFLP